MEDLKKDKRRKAIYEDNTDSFQLVKPVVINNGGEIIEWHKYGKCKSIKAIYDIVNRGEPYQIIDMDNKTKDELERYTRLKESKLVKEL